MRTLAIVKLGGTFPDWARRHGDFEDWIRSGMGLSDGLARVVCPGEGDDLPSADVLSGVVLTGAHHFVTDHLDWSERTSAWLPRVIEAGVPVLGICYGHQLLARAMGGEVGANPRGREFGTVATQLLPEAFGDALFAGQPPSLAVQTSHQQTVLKLPAGATVLAASDRDPHHAYRLGSRAWGVQFHPEFDADIVRTYIREFADRLREEGQRPEELLAGVRQTPHSHGLLRRFAQLATGRC